MNTCAVGFEAVLEQETEDGKTAPITIASRPTSPAEQKFAVTELEVASLAFALEHFKVYALGNPVTVYMHRSPDIGKVLLAVLEELDQGDFNKMVLEVD